MSQTVIVSKRDLALLRLLEMTPATAAQVRKASVTFPGEAFRDERRVRERLQVLGQVGLVVGLPAAVVGGGVMHYYRLTPAGYKALHPDSEQPSARPAAADIAPSLFQHAMATAEVIVHTEGLSDWGHLLDALNVSKPVIVSPWPCHRCRARIIGTVFTKSPVPSWPSEVSQTGWNRPIWSPTGERWSFPAVATLRT